MRATSLRFVHGGGVTHTLIEGKKASSRVLGSATALSRGPVTTLLNKSNRGVLYFCPMADVHDKKTRSYNMSRIRSKDTKPEMLVRSSDGLGS
jgi:hypothetical protein